MTRHSSTLTPIWALAAIGAVALHVGGFAAVFAGSFADDDTAQGAPAIEIGFELLTPRAEPSELPPGREADSANASQAEQEQKAVAEQADLPKSVPNETDDPDRLVTTETVKKPDQKEPEAAAIQATSSLQSAASEATAPPASEITEASLRSVAPALGTGEAATRIRLTWQRQLVAHLDHHKRYPAARSRKNAEIVLNFTLDRSGHVVSAAISRGSGDATFDEAALAMMKRADPVPAPPPLIADEGLSFTLPVLFRNRKG